MPTCHKCQATFPNKLVIDGRQRVLHRRKYCLQCSPFNQHNTAKLEQDREQGLCRRCDKVFVYDRSKGHRRTICNNCLIHKNRLSLKEWAIAYKGGCCALCGYNRCIAALQFHHIDSASKTFAISGSHTRRKSSLTKELDKCILLCANCHAELHAGFVAMPEWRKGSAAVL